MNRYLSLTVTDWLRPLRISTGVLLLLAGVTLGLIPGTIQAETYYIGPDGSDRNNGSSAEASWRTFDHAVGQLQPGDTLLVLDGTYIATEDENPLHVNCGENARNGTWLAPITVKAAGERRAWLDGDGSTLPVQIQDCSYWNVHGLRASSGDFEGGEPHIFKVSDSDHIKLQRLLLHHNNRYTNGQGLSISASYHVLVEESEVYVFHRHAISAYQSEHITLRRNYVDGRDAADLPDGRGSHRCCQQAGDEGYSFYFTSNSILENNISVHSEQLSIVGGDKTVLGNPGGQHVRSLGNISFKDLRPGMIVSRIYFDTERPYPGPAKDIVYKDFLVIGGQTIDEGGAFTPWVVKDLTIEGSTWINMKHTAINAPATQRLFDDRIFFGCEGIEGCTYRVRNSLFLNTTYTNEGPLLRVGPQDQKMDWTLSYSNAWNAEQPERGFGVEEPIDDDSGRYQHSRSTKPTGIGLDQGECVVYIPESSSMSGAGKDGADVGATILYRYENGRLTDEPLWDPETGAFPHGAVIEGSPNAVEGKSAFDVHERLNVNTNGCPLPYRE